MQMEKEVEVEGFNFIFMPSIAYKMQGEGRKIDREKERGKNGKSID